MPNPIKYTTGTETLALKKGNFYIGTGDVGKGPSDVTGYYQGISPSSGGYVIYMNRSGAPGDLSYHNAPTDNDLITFTNNLAGQSYTTVQQCLVYYAGQSDKVVLNRDYESIVTDGLIFNLDAGFTPSYPKNGTTWYNLNSSINGSLTNGPTFNSDNGGSIVFDGVNDYANLNIKCSDFVSDNGDMTLQLWFNISQYPSVNLGYGLFGGSKYFSESGGGGFMIINRTNGFFGGVFINAVSDTGYPVYMSNSNILINNWYHTALTYNNGTSNLYFDGQLITTITGVTYTSNSINFQLGGVPQGGWEPRMPGKISNAQIYNRALSADEVLQNFNAQKGRFGL